MTYPDERAAGTLKGAPPSVTPAMQHANDLHEMAGRFTDLNGRLMQAISRLVGPLPDTAGADVNAAKPQDGVLHVATFGAQRLRMETERYAELLGRLEAIV